MQLDDVSTDVTSIANSVAQAIQATNAPVAPAYTGSVAGLPAAATVSLSTLVIVGGLAYFLLKGRR